MRYTQLQMDEIIAQLEQIKINDEYVFVVSRNDRPRKYFHSIYIDSGPTVAVLEFEEAPLWEEAKQKASENNGGSC